MNRNPAPNLRVLTGVREVAARAGAQPLRIAMIGGGYVGLVTAACLADVGHDLTVVERDPERVAALLNGHMPIHEPGLERLVELNRLRRRIRFTDDLPAAVVDADAVFIAVGTPSRGDDGNADLSQVEAAVRGIARHLKLDAILVIKSTVPVGTGDRLVDILREERPDGDWPIVSNPEFLRAGAAIDDFRRPDRIVVGTDDRHAREVMARIYRPVADDGAPILFTSRRTAELTKYAANAFLATKITFMNEIADLCEIAGADVEDIAHCMGLDRRIGPDFLKAGPGIGGSCFPKDTLALMRQGEAVGVSLNVVAAASRSNMARKASMADRVAAALGGSVAGATVAVLGLTFKANTDDMRESPALEIIPALQRAGATVRAYDPKGMAASEKLLPGLTFAETAYACATGADAVLVLTEWSEFRTLHLAKLGALMARPVMIDLRNLFAPEDARAAGLSYHSIGRAPAVPGAHVPQPETKQTQRFLA